MQQPVIPICFFPSSVMMLCPEDAWYGCELFTQERSILSQVFHTPEEALRFIQKSEKDAAWLAIQCTQHARFLTQGDMPAESGWASILAELYNPYRFEELSVLLVDLSVLGEAGMDWLFSCETRSFKVLLMISAHEEARTRQALEMGLIDSYMIKTPHLSVQQIRDKVLELQRCYFKDMSIAISRVRGQSLPSCLYDADFAFAFETRRDAFGAVEYYLMDETGGFIVLDANARAEAFNRSQSIEPIAYTALQLEHIVSYDEYQKALKESEPVCV